MLDSRAKEVLRIGDQLFSQKEPINSLWQEIALNFYPERADFTTSRSTGDEFSDHLFTSSPVVARRELGNMLPAAIRPSSQEWGSIHVENEDLDEADEVRDFLERLTSIQWRAMYDARTGFVRATNQTDHDFVTFGNGVIKVGLNANADGLLYQNFHLRDCAWSDNIEGHVDAMHRRWKPTARQLVQYFPKTVSQKVKEAFEKDPEKPFNCRHVVLPARVYDLKKKNGQQFPFVSLYVEEETQTVLEEVGQNSFGYVVPRWQTIAESAYAVSMATSIMLPDGRTAQVVMRTLREAAEKFVDPPMIAIADAIRGDYALYPGGVTIADIEYDERLGEVLRPLTQDRGGMPIGFDIAMALKQDIRAGFFLDKIQLPEANREMTAYQIRKILEEQIRASSPIYEPIEKTYNTPLCEETFNLLRDNGGFPIQDMPEVLRGRDVKFKFRSPLSDMADRAEAQTFLEVMNTMVIPAAQIDPSQVANVNLTVALRDAMRAAGWKTKWFNPVEAVEQQKQQIEQQQQMAQAAQLAQQIGATTQSGGRGIQSLAQALPALAGPGGGGGDAAAASAGVAGLEALQDVG